jgi:hypothetical protein
MGDLTKNLSRSEFACRCGCGFDTVDFKLALNLQDAVNHFTFYDGIDVRIAITGPNRCVSHNEEVQFEADPDYVPMSSKSQHLYARAADFKLFNRATGEQIDPARVADYLSETYAGKYGVGRYLSYTHADTRTLGPKRW